MTRYHLKDLTNARLQYTDVFQLTQADLTTAVANTQQAVTLSTINVGDLVDPLMILEVITPSVGLATCNISVGVTGALTQFIGASNALPAGSLYYAPANTVAGYVGLTAGGIALVANFTPGAAEALNACTALTARVWTSISRSLDRQTIQF